MGDYNPDRPYVLGMQWAPLHADAVLLDTCTEIGYTFRAGTSYQSTDGFRHAWVMTGQPPPGQPAGKHLAVNVYRHAQPAGTGPIRTLAIACTSGSVQTGATLAGGAASVADAVTNPSDARHVAVNGPGAFCRFWFGTTAPGVRAVLRNRRILDVSVLYAISGPFDKVPGGTTLGLERAGTNWLMDDTLTGPSTPAGAVAVRRSRLGELNPWCHSTNSPAVSAMRLPWRLEGRPDAPTPTAGLDALASSGTGGVAVRIGTTSAAPAGTVFQIHHVALEVSYGQENRAGAGGLDLSAGASLIDGVYVFQVPIVDMWSYGYDVTLNRGERHAVTVGLAHAGAVSVSSPVPIRVNRLSTLTAFPTHTGLVVRKTCGAGDTPTAQAVPALPAIVLHKPGSPPVPDRSGHAYLAQTVATACNWYPASGLSQTVTDDAAGTYVWARFYARHLPGTDEPLTLVQLNATDPQVRPGPRAQISVAEFDVLPEVADGWREVTLRLDPPAQLTGDGAVTRWGWYSPVDGATPWQILGADQNPTSGQASALAPAGYGGQATIDNQDDASADLTLMLVREMDPVTGLTATTVTQTLAPVDPSCPGRSGRVPTGIYYHRLSWDAINSAVVGGWGCYELQRQDDTMPAEQWETIARIAEPAVTGVDDVEARIGVPSRYRVRMVHRTGISGPWSSPVSATIPAPGVTGTDRAGLLVFTSNHHPGASLAYLTGADRREGGEEFTFPEAGQVEWQQMYGRDYRVAARPAERGGMEFTRTLLVNAAAVPATTMDKGFTGLRDLAWDSLPYVCVRDEIGNRWLAALLVPTGTVRRRGHLHLAPVTVVEVTDTPAPVDGGPAPCEGLAGAAGSTSVDAETPTPAAVTHQRVADTFSRTVTGGWGATDLPGLPWQVIQGPAADVSVHDGVATMLLRPDSTVIRLVTAPDDMADVDVRARVRIDSTAVGAPVNAYLIGRDLDGANYYRARLAWQPDGTISVGLERLDGGTLTTIAPLTPAQNRDGSPLTYRAGQWTWLRLQVRGAVVQAGAWRDGQPFGGWPVQVVDTTHTTSGRCGIRAALSNGNTNPPVAVDVDDLQVHQPMADIDIRVLLRTGDDDWTVEVAHYSYVTENTVGSGWNVRWSSTSTCLEIFGKDVFYQCVPTDELKLVPRQRTWLRAVYQHNDGAGQARMTLSASPDNTIWTPLFTATGIPEPLDLDPGRLIVLLRGQVSVSAVQVRHGVTGPVIAGPNFEAQPPGTTAFTDDQGNQWKVNGRGICPLD